MEEAILRLAAISFLLIGVSHIARPTVWVELFQLIREKGEAGAFINGFIHFPLGALIVAFHNVWTGIPIVLTLIGYGLILKGIVCFVFPAHALRSLKRVSIERAWELRVAGLFSVALGGLFAYSVLAK